VFIKTGRDQRSKVTFSVLGPNHEFVGLFTWKLRREGVEILLELLRFTSHTHLEPIVETNSPEGQTALREIRAYVCQASLEEHVDLLVDVLANFRVLELLVHSVQILQAKLHNIDAHREGLGGAEKDYGVEDQGEGLGGKVAGELDFGEGLIVAVGH